jgi:hypothetical protein
MLDRRTFVSAALALGLHSRSRSAELQSGPAEAAMERLRAFYRGLKSYADVTRIVSTGSRAGVPVPSGVLTAFAAPAKLCMQWAGSQGIRNCFIVDGERHFNWHREGGWLNDSDTEFTLSLLLSASTFQGPYAYCLAALLLNQQLAEAPWIQGLQQARCAAAGSNRCARIEGTIKQVRVAVDLADNGPMSRMRSEAEVMGISVSATADVDARLNPAIDLDALIAAARVNPEKPMRLPKA